MPDSNLLHSLLQHSSAKGSKSTAMQPLAWIIGLLLTSTLGVFYIKAPEWIAKIFIALCVIMIILYIGAYLYFMLKNPDALRSESFTLKKMEIQKGIQGDNITGISNESIEIDQNYIENYTEEGR